MPLVLTTQIEFCITLFVQYEQCDLPHLADLPVGRHREKILKVGDFVL